MQEDRTDPAANRDKIGKKAPSASATFGKNSTLTIDHGQLDEKQKTAKLTMNSADFQAGDTYTITIPKKGGLSLGKTDVAVLAPVLGRLLLLKLSIITRSKIISLMVALLLKTLICIMIRI